MGSCPAAEQKNEKTSIGTDRDSGHRHRVPISILPVRPSAFLQDLLMAPLVSPHTDAVFVCVRLANPHTHTQVCIVCLFTHTYLSLRIVSIPISFLHSFFFALVFRLAYTDSQMRMALLYICLDAMRRMQMNDNILIVEI